MSLKDNSFDKVGQLLSFYTSLELPLDNTSVNTVLALGINDLMALEIIYQRCKEHNSVTESELRVNKKLSEIYTDYQSYYFFSSKVLLDTYRIMFERLNLTMPGAINFKKINTHANFRKFITENGRDLKDGIAYEMYASFGWLYESIFSKIVTKRNKIVEHWSDNVHSEMFAHYAKISENSVLYFVNRDEFDEWFTKNNNIQTIFGKWARRARLSICFRDNAIMISYGDIKYWEFNQTERQQWDVVMGNYEKILPLYIDDALMDSFILLIKSMIDFSVSYKFPNS